MLKKISAMAITAGLLTLTPVISAGATPAPAPPQGGQRKEQHPHFRAAIRELQEARCELETASHDFSGHRKEAIEAVDNAIWQLQQALQYASK